MTSKNFIPNQNVGLLKKNKREELKFANKKFHDIKCEGIEMESIA
jgi:hypothetical protein